MRRFFVGGNWKLNPAKKEQVKALVDSLNAAKLPAQVDIVVGPSAVHLDFVRSTLAHSIGVAGQNVYTEDTGAFTGENSAAMLKDLAIDWVILGHSERRNVFKETDQDVGKKTAFALSKGLKVILCVGELLSEREANKTTEVVYRQLQAVKEHVTDWSNIVIAYEPVWAIGTGKNATAQQAQEVHVDIRRWLKDTLNESTAQTTRIIYGGSVNAKNCRELAAEADIDGFLVGGASLKPEFIDIINSKI